MSEDKTTKEQKAPVKEEKKLSLGEQLRKDMNDPKGDLRNQVGPENTRDFQLLSNTPLQIIAAMTGFSQEELFERAKEIGAVPKGSGAGDLRK